MLNDAQKKAVNFFNNEVDSYVKRHLDESTYSSISEQEIKEFVKNAEVRINRKFMSDESLDDLMETGIMKNQFSTHTSSGCCEPYKNGMRDRWEEDLFGGAYHESEEYKNLNRGDFLPDNLARQRPCYGYITDKRNKETRNADQYGGTAFVLKPHVLERSTMTYCNSSVVGVDLVGEIGATLKSPHNIIIENRQDGEEGVFKRKGRFIYNEAQIHGEVNLQHDVSKMYIRRGWYYDYYEFDDKLVDKKIAKIVKLAEKWGIPYKIISNERF